MAETSQQSYPVPTAPQALPPRVPGLLNYHSRYKTFLSALTVGAGASVSYYQHQQDCYTRPRGASVSYYQHQQDCYTRPRGASVSYYQHQQDCYTRPRGASVS
ncbi:MAG: hypothetical protein P5672_22100, partial [Limnospira sp. PMC 1234.20]